MKHSARKMIHGQKFLSKLTPSNIVMVQRLNREASNSKVKLSMDHYGYTIESKVIHYVIQIRSIYYREQSNPLRNNEVHATHTGSNIKNLRGEDYT